MFGTAFVRSHDEPWVSDWWVPCMVATLSRSGDHAYIHEAWLMDEAGRTVEHWVAA
jgi:hypothetical protein